MRRRLRPALTVTAVLVAAGGMALVLVWGPQQFAPRTDPAPPPTLKAVPRQALLNAGVDLETPSPPPLWCGHLPALPWAARTLTESGCLPSSRAAADRAMAPRKVKEGVLADCSAPRLNLSHRLCWALVVSGQTTNIPGLPVTTKVVVFSTTVDLVDAGTNRRLGEVSIQNGTGTPSPLNSPSVTAPGKVPVQTPGPGVKVPGGPAGPPAVTAPTTVDKTPAAT